MSYPLTTPKDVRETLASRVRQLRLLADWKQETLAERAGISLATVRRYEKTGQTTVDNLLKIALALGNLDDFMHVLQPPPAKSVRELERRERQSEKQRGQR